MFNNPAIETDFYKTTQPRMYAPEVEGIFSYIESRGGEYPITVFFGLQAWLLRTPGFSKENPLTKAHVDKADLIISAMGGFPYDRSAHDIVVNEYGGVYPITIHAVKEGSKVPYKNALCTIEITEDSRIFSLVGYLETAILRAIWFPSTIASRVYAMKANIDGLYARFADSSATTDFAFLDFSARGVESADASAIGSAAFLTSFLGTDTIAGVELVYDLYGQEVIGGSVAASEHSVMCSYGEAREEFSFEHIVEGTPDNTILSVVSDTWDIYRACEYWNKLAPRIAAKGLQMVIRPDSGDPLEVIPKMLQILSKGFKTHLNDKGLKVFDNLKILWGDGVDESNYLQIIGIVIKAGYGPEVIILGSGGGLMQKVNRDTGKWALKASAVYVNRSWKPIKKDPITDSGKKSKAGKLALVTDRHDGQIKTVDWTLAPQMGPNMLELVFDGKSVVRTQTMVDIRAIVAS